MSDKGSSTKESRMATSVSNKVWTQFEGREPCKVTISEDTDIDDLKAIAIRHSNQQDKITAYDIQVKRADTILCPGNKVTTEMIDDWGKTSEKPFLFHIIPADEPPAKKKPKLDQDEPTAEKLDREFTNALNSVANMSASQFARSSSWTKVIPPYKKNYRFQRTFEAGEDTFNVPISLLCKEFGTFIHQYTTMDATTISLDLMKCVQNIINEMAKTYPDEESRKSTLLELLTDFCKQPIVKEDDTDGCIVYLVDSCIIAALIMEAKNEECSTNYDPVMQALDYYTKFISKYVSKTASTKRRCCPCIVVTICGPNMRVLGIVNQATCVVYECLVPTLKLACIPGSHISNSICFCMAALKATVDSLHKYYNTNGIISSNFPYFCSYTSKKDDGSREECEIQYISQLERLVYSAKIVNNTTNTTVEAIVKFAEVYGTEAHNFMASRGYSPKILHTEELKPKWNVIIMEKWELTKIQHSSEVEKLEMAINIFHAQKFVHGDLRPSNVFKRNGNIAVIDFDWAGNENEAKYPLWMNPELSWPSDAAPGQYITKEHDNYWIDILKEQVAHA